MTVRIWLLGVALLASLAGGASDADAQGAAARFEITVVGDSTFSFPLGNRRWVRPGQRGIVVDPRRGDELVARCRIVTVARDSATALVTGQTTSLDAGHVVLLELPDSPWYRERSFWVGTLSGALLGALIGAGI